MHSQFRVLTITFILTVHYRYYDSLCEHRKFSLFGVVVNV